MNTIPLTARIAETASPGTLQRDRLFRYRPASQRLDIAKRECGAVSIGDVVTADPEWLWPDRIPLGYITLLVGDPGVGKSLLALNIAARVTDGRPWPHFPVPIAPVHCRLPPSSVLLISFEDRVAGAVRPRLNAAGANCTHVLTLSYVPGSKPSAPARLFSLARDLNRLANLLTEMPDCRLIVIDPIMPFLGDTNDQSNSKIWKLLSSLAGLARKFNVAVLIVNHLRKREGAAVYRAMGSLAFIAAARAAWLVARNPADANQRLLLPLKNNLVENLRGIKFAIDSDESLHAPVIRWLPDIVETHADAVLSSYRSPGRPDDERRFAVQWLRDELSRGQSPMRTIREAAEAHGISCTTLRRAFRELGGQAVFVKQDDRARWDWRRPVIDDQNPSAGFRSSMNLHTPDCVTDATVPPALPTPHSKLPTPPSLPDPRPLTPQATIPIMTTS